MQGFRRLGRENTPERLTDVLATLEPLGPEGLTTRAAPPGREKLRGVIDASHSDYGKAQP